MSTLPEGWARTTLGNVHTINPRHPKDVDKKQTISFVPMLAVSEQTGLISDAEERVLEQVWTGYTHFRNGDVLFAKITPCMENGKIAVASDLTNGLGCGTTEFHVLRSIGATEPKLVWYYLRDYSFRTNAERSMTGAVGQRRVPKSYLEEHSFLLPPLAEQRRIVEKLDALNAHSRAAATALTRIETLISRYKTAVLGAAFDPDGIGAESRWQERTIAEVGDVALGRQRSPKDHQGPHMRPYIRAANITWDGLDLSDVKKMNFSPSEFEVFQLQPGDVLVNEGSGSAKEVGKPAIWRGEIENCCFQNTTIRIRPKQCTSQYLYYYLLFCARSMRFVRETQGVNIHHIGKRGLAEFPIPLPESLEKQAEIVARIEAAFAQIENLTRATATARVRISTLDRAILARAFKGKLVPQNPNDEPASELLKRVKGKQN
ncbi:restriction endonuclease subunit S [Hyphomonas sp.]|uniref:restriction endonuclease subunit S n=1 Tax=Hyphomonas sp. TaxID=87 RepID=UPI0025C623F5|nr:restriction endonuclease subunit S [Hyphomonas sp.]MBI1399706.1 type I restriction endonuclease subunit S [Hyphomonas sp.]